MRTQTIFEAFDRAFHGVDWIIPSKRIRQKKMFRAELLRRMAHYDAIRGPWVEALR